MSCEVFCSDGRIRIEGDLTIYAAPEAKDQLLAHLKATSCGAPFDLSGVREMDTAGLQLVLLAQRYCRAAGGKFSIVAASAAALETLALCGLSHLLAPSGAQP